MGRYFLGLLSSFSRVGKREERGAVVMEDTPGVTGGAGVVGVAGGMVVAVVEREAKDMVWGVVGVGGGGGSDTDVVDDDDVVVVVVVVVELDAVAEDTEIERDTGGSIFSCAASCCWRLRRKNNFHLENDVFL